MVQDLLQVPVSLMLAGDLPASAKLIWMVAQLRSAPVRPGPGWLCAISGLSRPTVLAGVAGLIAAGWDPILVVEPDTTVPIPALLLQNPRLGIHSRLLYGHLLMTPGFSHPCGHFTNAELAALARVTVPTVINAISELVRAEWIKVDRKHRLARTTFELTFPGWARGMAALDKATQRLQIPGHRGEMLMREYLTLLIDQENYQDNATPPRLANPPTDGLLQLDRYYSPTVGFEFNGAQHYKSTKK